MNKFNTLSIKSIFIAVNDPDLFYFFNSAILSVFKSVDVLRTTDGVMLLSLMEFSAIPDIIFLDLNIPFKKGISCLKAIRSNEKYTSVQVVMFSSAGNTDDIDRCYDKGANFYLISPKSLSFAVQQLKNLLKNEYFINNRRPPREDFIVDSNYPQL